jgi:transcriptional regulator with XRE-family HTH domain
VNETLYGALLRAGLSEQDVAVRLQVDPKTVRRWLEGRVPQLRHRWALASILGQDGADLWPQVRAARAARSRPAEICAVYPNRQAVPAQVWQALFESAKHEIGILSRSGLFLAEDAGILAILVRKAQAGVSARICLADPDGPETAERDQVPGAGGVSAARVRSALARYEPLRQSSGAQVRLHRAIFYNSIYRADDQLLVSQHAYGIPGARTPVLHLQKTEDDDVAATYLESFERIWIGAVQLA